MSKVWGPMGWLTLHSVAAVYPNQPSQQDKMIARRFLDLFTETITCRFCKDHFFRAYKLYSSNVPGFLDSKQNFMLFTLRAHNETNRSLDKPILASVADCIASLKNATSVTNAQTFKDNYMSYLIRTWAHEMSGEALIYKNKAILMRDILRPLNLTNAFDITLQDDDARYAFSIPKKESVMYDTYNAIKVGFNGGRLKLH